MEYYIIPAKVKQEFYEQLKIKTKDLYNSICAYMSFKDKMLLYSFGDISKIFKDKKENSLFIGVDDNDVIKKIGSYYIQKMDIDEKCINTKRIYLTLDEFLIGKEGMEIINLLQNKGRVLGIDINAIVEVFKSVDLFIDMRIFGKMKVNFISKEKKETICCYVVCNANFNFKLKENFILNEKKETNKNRSCNQISV